MEFLCESPYPVQRSGCCADGRKCDEICIALAAAAHCREACHNDLGTTQRCQTSCCDDTAPSKISVSYSVQDRHKTNVDQASEVGSECARSCCGDDHDTPEDDPSKQDFDFVASAAVLDKDNEMENSCKADCCELQEKDLTIGDITQIDEGQETPCCTQPGQCSSPNPLPESKKVVEHAVSTFSCSQDVSSIEMIEPSSCRPVAQIDNAKMKKVDSEQRSGWDASKHEDCRVDGCCEVESATSPAENSIREAVVSDFKEACSMHLEQAMQKYSDYINAGLCICRSVLSRTGICCDEKKRAAVSKKRKVSSRDMMLTNATLKKRQKSDESISTRDQCCKKSCCSRIEKTNALELSTDCNPKPQELVVLEPCLANKSRSEGRRDSCCEGVATPYARRPGQILKIDEQHGEPRAVNHSHDIEQSAAREHVLFSVSGMTCTGCVKKITGVFDHINGVDNVKVNFVAAMCDIDIDTSKVDAKGVLEQLERETGFKCSRVLLDYQKLDVFMDEVKAQQLSTQICKGIVSIEKAGKAHRITFNPLIIGAREVVRHSGGTLAPPSDNGAIAGGRRIFILKLWSFIAAAVLTIPVVTLAWGDTTVPYKVRSIISLILATFVQAIAVPEFYTPALKALIFSKSIEMDMLVVISITAAYGYSIVAFGLTHSGIELQQGEFFETSTLLITLVLLGRLVSSYAKVRAVQAVSLKSLQAETAHLEDDSANTTEIDARLLEFGDVIMIHSHSKVVSDGTVVRGESAVDESMLTGESVPVRKVVGDNVVAGTINGEGPLSVRLTRLPGQNSITDIANLVQNAIRTKPRIQDLADVVAGWFIPVVISISIIVFVTWILVALKIRDENAGSAIGLSITYGIAVLAISCPCALGLAVPLVLVIAGGVAAKGGVIIKEADATERGFKVTDVVFDKTGTLTTGELLVTGKVFHELGELTEQEGLSVAYGLVKDNGHPVSQALSKHLQAQVVRPADLTNVKSIPGAGIEAVWKSSIVKAGNPYWLGVASSEPVADLLATDCSTLLCISIGDQLLISFSLRSNLRPEASAVISELNARGIVSHVVSGDHLTVVADIADTLGIAANNIAARQSPSDKQQYIQNLISAGKTTLFVGDGTNDAVAIAQANVGVQIGSASDITRATADVVLLGGLDGILVLLDVSKQAYHRIVFNFAWSVVYNVFAILLAAGAFVKVRIPPSYAGLGEIVSVLPVVLAAMTLMKVKVGAR